MSGALFPLDRAVVAPGAVHVPGWLPLGRQRELVEACRGWARGPVPLRHTVLPNGGVMSVRTVCVGWHWQPYRYSRTADDVNGAPVAPFPGWLVDLGREALVEAYGEHQGYTPDTALINFYDGAARMGMHQDKEERSGAPVVSLSIGDSACSGSGTRRPEGVPTRTWSWRPATCSSSAALPATPITACRRCMRPRPILRPA
jgi:DNA oxidative demethylase